MPFLNVFHNIHGIFAEKSIEKKIFRLKSTELSTEYRYRRYFLKNVPLSVPSLLFSKVSVPISLLLLKYRVHVQHLCIYLCHVFYFQINNL